MNETPEQLSEQAGHAEGASLIEYFRKSKTQAERLQMLHECLQELSKSEYQQNALAGFSVAVISYLERGIGIR